MKADALLLVTVLVHLGMEIVMLLKRAFQHHSQSAYADFASYLLLSAAVMHSLSDRCVSFEHMSVQGEDEEADWDLELLNEEDDGVVHWVRTSLPRLQPVAASALHLPVVSSTSM